MALAIPGEHYFSMYRYKPILKRIPFLLVIFIMGNCSTTQMKFKQQYAKVWKETIKSEAWKNSLVEDNENPGAGSLDFYASTENSGIENVSAVNKTGSDLGFDQKYGIMVSRAYYKIIAEAEKADFRLSAEYENLTFRREQNASRKTDRSIRGNLAMANKKYLAHKEMLEGLKSWNIMSEYGSDDLDFFKAEHKSEVAAMVREGKSEEGIINFLVYKLADLYHFEK
ncbi:MAG TPA: hypothetical protein VKN36_16995 [Eudoraea sp.]|nr:hypothetical protein [Eudoraea sp.]